MGMEAKTGQFSHCCWSCLLRASSPCWWARIWPLPSCPMRGQVNTRSDGPGLCQRILTKRGFDSGAKAKRTGGRKSGRRDKGESCGLAAGVLR